MHGATIEIDDKERKLQAVCNSKVQQKCCENVFVTFGHEGTHHLLSCTVEQKSNCQLSCTTDTFLSVPSTCARNM